MSKTHIITAENLEEIREARKINKNKNVDKRLRAIELRGLGKDNKEISQITGYEVNYISVLVGKYVRSGITSITSNRYKGNRQLLSDEEELELLKPFIEKAEAGHVLEISEIRKAYEKKIGRKLNSNGHIYQVLKRHNFRKVMPRSKHPNSACDEVIHSTKKLTL